MAKEEVKIKSVLIKPRLTEKAAILPDKVNAYVFEVLKTATKKSVRDSVKAKYKVTAEKVRIVNSKDLKKAYVYLKKGDKIKLYEKV